jgi:hypothetical protein
VLKNIVLAVSALVGLLIAFDVYLGTRPELLLNPLTRQLYLSPKSAYSPGYRSDPIPLPPDIAAGGMPRDALHARLSAAGFRLSADTARREGGRDLSSIIDAPSWSFPICGAMYSIEVKADPAGNVLSVAAYEFHTCFDEVSAGDTIECCRVEQVTRSLQSAVGRTSPLGLARTERKTALTASKACSRAEQSAPLLLS